MSDLTWDIRRSIQGARETLDTAKKSAREIGLLASDYMILRNMSGSDLANIKKQLKNFNSHTRKWNEVTK